MVIKQSDTSSTVGGGWEVSFAIFSETSLIEEPAAINCPSSASLRADHRGKSWTAESVSSSGTMGSKDELYISVGLLIADNEVGVCGTSDVSDRFTLVDCTRRGLLLASMGRFRREDGSILQRNETG